MRFAWFILIYCCLVEADVTTVPTTKDQTNQTEIVFVIPLDKTNNKSNDNKSISDLDAKSTKSRNSTNSTNLTLAANLTEVKPSKRVFKDDLLSALPSTSTLTTLPANQFKHNKPNREIRTDIVHKSIPIQRGIIKSRPIAGVKSSNNQYSRQVKDVKSAPFEELQTERSTVIASTRPAPDQTSIKQTTPSLPDSTTALITETSDQLVRRASLSKNNFKSGKTSEPRHGEAKTSPKNSIKNMSNRNDQYDLQPDYDPQQDNNQSSDDTTTKKQENNSSANDEQQARQLVPSDEQAMNREICDFCLYEGEGNFTSYHYPIPYKANLNCSYRVQRVDEFDTCALEIYFHEFDIPIMPGLASELVSGKTKNAFDESASNECKGDYLEIQGRRFCGNGWMNKMETIAFPPEQTELTFKFRSDHRGSGRGFWIEVKRKPNSCYGRTPPIKKCEKRYSEMRFAMTSPQFPNTYQNNINCDYFVRKATPDVCGLEMKFSHFDIEPVNGCFYDFFEIEGEKLCGTMRSNTIKRLKFAPETDQKQFNFHSDKQVAKTGFKIEVVQLTNCDSIFDEQNENDLMNNAKLEQLPAPPSCSVCTSDKDGTLVSYGYPVNYRNNLHCSYTIDRNSDRYCGLQLQFEDFNVAPSQNCEEDYLQIVDEKFCGTTLHSTTKLISFKNIRTKPSESSYDDSLVPTNSSIQMLFHTNQMQTSKGFMIKFQQIKCNSIEEEMDDKSKVPSNEISGSNDYDIARYSGQREQDKTNQLDIMNVYSTTPMPPIQCEHHYNSKYFTLISPNTTSLESGEMDNSGQPIFSYPNNLACEYRIVQNSSQVCYLELTFRKFDVEASAKCQFDYLEVNNVRLCGTLQRQTTRTYIFNTMTKVIHFRTDASTSRSGFKIDVEQLECNGDRIIRPDLAMLNNVTTNNKNHQQSVEHNSNRPLFNMGSTKGSTMYNVNNMNNMNNNMNNMQSKDNSSMMTDLCAKTYQEEEFDLFSLNFPLNYPLNSFCVYTIQRSSPQVCKFEINFMQFNIENSKNGICSADYLDIMGNKVCGSLGSNTVRQFVFPLDRNDVRIVFSANNLRSENDFGFYLRIKQMNCNDQLMNPINTPQAPYIEQQQPNDYPSNPLFSDPTLAGNCNEMFVQSVFQLKSPGFPVSYVRNLNCMYKIIKQKPEVCQLEVHVIDFNVQPNVNTGQAMSIMQSFECGNEYVDFNGEQVCGRIASRVVRYFPFTGQEFLIKFKSGYTDLDNSSNVERAFLLQVRQRECAHLMQPNQINGSNNPEMAGIKVGNPPSVVQNNIERKKQIEVCDQQYDSELFEIKYAVQMPKGGSTNTENRTRNCLYTIRKYMPSVCAIEFTFHEFIITDSNEGEMMKTGRQPMVKNCETDYLRLTETEKLCSNIPNLMVKKIPFNEDMKTLQLHLTTLSFMDSKRIYIKVRQIDCSPNENSIAPNPHYQSPTLIAQSPSINPTLHTPPISINQLPSQPVQQQYAETYNNESTSNRHNQIDFMTHSLSICELCYTELSGEIVSYNYPAMYPSNLNCRYKITSQSGFCGVYLRFDVFQLNNAETRSAATPCTDDYLELNSVKYCGKQLENVKKILAFENDPKELSFRFVSKKHTIGNGFKLNYMQIPCYLTPSQQSILTAMMTDPAATNTQQNGSSSKKFALPSKTNYASQENQVQENEMNENYQAFYSSADLNPTTQTPVQQSINSNSTLVATNNTSANDLNPSSSVQSIPRLPCDQAIYDKFFEIRSPNYPLTPYQPNSDCLYSVRRLNSNICKLRLYFADFELESDHNFKLIKDNHSLHRNLLHQSDGCNEDYLEINEKFRFCGAQLNGTLRDFDFTSYKFPLRFRTNEEGSERGFLIRGEQIRCIPNSLMFPNSDKQPNQLQSSDSILSYKLNNVNRIPGLDQVGFYTAPPVTHNSTNYSSSSSATFRSPVRTSATNSSTSSQQSSATAQSSSLNNSESQTFLSPNSAYQSASDSPFQWSIPSAPYMISIKGQQVSISGEHSNSYYANSNETSPPKSGDLHSTQKTNLQVINEDANTAASDGDHHTSSSTSQYNCNQVISDPVFEITSPYYPHRYDSSTRCLITIQKYARSVCHLDLIFIKFDLGSTADCNLYTDYLSINGERFCGHYFHNRSLHFSMPNDISRAVMKRTFRFDGPTLQMRFNGEIGTGYGFYLRGKQVQCAIVGKDYLGRISELNDPHHDSLHPSIDHHSDDHHSNEGHSDEHDHHLDHPNSHSDHLNPVTHHNEFVHDHHPAHLNKPPYHYHPDYYRDLHRDNLTHLDHNPRHNHTVRLHLNNKVLQHQDLNNTTNYFNYPPQVDLHHMTHNYQTNKNENTNHTINNLTRNHHLQNHYNTHNYHTNNQASHDTKYNVSNYLIDSNKLVGVPRSLTSLSHCDQIISTDYIQIQSPNHPSNYPNNILCRYVIQRPNNLTCAIDLTFVNFNLEEEDRCSKDYFEIDGARICGTLPPYHQRRYYYFSGESEKVLTFRSDLFISNSGFSIVGQQITNCNSFTSRTDNSPIKCDVQTDSVKGELISKNYPSSYDHNMQCTYKIRAADQRFCRLSLRIRDFDIRSNANCDDDYLYVDGERLCNANLRKNEMTLYFPENGVARELQFNFYSNSIESGRGFYIEYLQELCIDSNEQKYRTGVGHSYPTSKQTNDPTSSQARSVPTNDSIQQTIALREQQSSVYKKAPPIYPPNYVARSNPVGEMIEAIDRQMDNQMNGDSMNSLTNHHSNSTSQNSLNYPTTYSQQGDTRSSPLFDGRRSQIRNGKQSDLDARDHTNSKKDKNEQWSGNIQLVKPTVSGNGVASFLGKLKMGDQVMTSVRGRYEVIESNKVKRQSSDE